MEVFSLLKYWRNPAADADSVNGSTTRTKTILAAVSHRDTSTDTDDVDDGDGDGPFFDLKLAVPEEGDEEEGMDDGENEESDGEIEREELKLSISSPVSTGDCTEPELSLSRSDSDEKSEISPANSASKLRVLLLKLKKPSPRNAAEKSDTGGSGSDSVTPKPPEKDETKSKSSFTLKFRIEEVFNRGNKSSPKEESSDDAVTAEEKRFSKEAIERYLKKVKPLYVRVSKRYVEKIRFSGLLDSPSPPAKSTAVNSEKESSKPSETSPVAIRSQKQGSFPAGLRIVCKHLGKSRSASSAAVPVPAPAKRCDDSFLQQQDGIQSAILHCKRSFNSWSSTDETDSDSSIFWRSASSDPSSSPHEESMSGCEEAVMKETTRNN